MSDTDVLANQLDFEGRTVTGIKMNLAAIGDVEYAIEGDPLSYHDEIEVVCRYTVADISHGGKHDRQGFETEAMKRRLVLVPKRGSLSISAVLRSEDIEAAWAREHGAPE